MSGSASFSPKDESLPVLDTTVGSVLRATAGRAPQSIAVVDGSAPGRPRRTWLQLLGDAERMAVGLLQRFEPGEAVALWAPSSAEWLIFEYGAALAGLTMVPLNPAFRSAELEYVLDRSGAAGVCLVEEFRGNPMGRTLEEVRPRLRRLRHVLTLDHWETWAGAEGTEPLAFPQVNPDDVAQIQFTSGTTGFPKGAMLHHRGITNNMRYNMLRTGMHAGDVFLSPVPMFHVGGAVMANLTALSAGSALVSAQSFSAGLALELIESEAATVMIGVPTMFIDMLAHPALAERDVASMRLMMIGGAGASPDLIRQLETTFGASVRNSYGQTECGSIIAATRSTTLYPMSPRRWVSHSPSSPSRSSIEGGRPWPAAHRASCVPRATR